MLLLCRYLIIFLTKYLGISTICTNLRDSKWIKESKWTSHLLHSTQLSFFFCVCEFYHQARRCTLKENQHFRADPINWFICCIWSDKQKRSITGIVWLPCRALMADWASLWPENLTNAQPEKEQGNTIIMYTILEAISFAIWLLDVLAKIENALQQI